VASGFLAMSYHTKSYVNIILSKTISFFRCFSDGILRNSGIGSGNSDSGPLSKGCGTGGIPNQGACRNLFFVVFGIFLAKKLSQSSKFQRGNIFTWPTFSHFVINLE
jgi:hypothetical protein